jgi:hypothetical protein
MVQSEIETMPSAVSRLEGRLRTVGVCGVSIHSSSKVNSSGGELYSRIYQ